MAFRMFPRLCEGAAATAGVGAQILIATAVDRYVNRGDSSQSMTATETHNQSQTQRVHEQHEPVASEKKMRYR